MRKPRPADALFSATRQGVLAATLLHPDKAWYQSDLARQLHLSPSTLQRELQSLSGAGILTRTEDRGRVYYQANAGCPFLSELQGLLVKTAGVLDVVRETLRPAVTKIDFAFIYGSFARMEQIAESDIDLMVVGSVGLARLSPLLKRAERRLGRPVNATFYQRAEFDEKVRSGNNFVLEVLRGRKLVVLGEVAEIEGGATE